jgi:hypothetical protein
LHENHQQCSRDTNEGWRQTNCLVQNRAEAESNTGYTKYKAKYSLPQQVIQINLLQQNITNQATEHTLKQYDSSL